MALFSLIKDASVKILIPKFQSPIYPLYASCSNDSKEGQDPDPPEPQLLTLPGEEAPRIRERQMRKCKVLVRGADDYSLISGVPIDITCGRVARIFQPAKNPMQSGTRHLGHWLLDFETKERWENANMGWCSTGDAISNVQMRFSTKEGAMDYCNRNRMNFWVQESHKKTKLKIRTYAGNFHYKNRTRLSTK